MKCKKAECKSFGAWCIMLFVTLFSLDANAQKSNAAKGDSLSVKEQQTKSDKITLTTYVRVISDANGNKRADENFVGNFKLINWLRLEAGFRQGQRPGHLDSYYHYKLELQSKYLWKLVRIIGRISDNVINYPTPSYRKTNKLFALELRVPLSKKIKILAGGGYVFSSQQYDMPDALPTSLGIQNNYPIFRFALRYAIKKGYVEAVYGSYDVFNPYGINTPFTQVDGEYELSRLCTLTSFFRYQYNYDLFRPNNYFLGVGLVFHLVKEK